MHARRRLTDAWVCERARTTDAEAEPEAQPAPTTTAAAPRQPTGKKKKLLDLPFQKNAASASASSIVADHEGLRPTRLRPAHAAPFSECAARSTSYADEAPPHASTADVSAAPPPERAAPASAPLPASTSATVASTAAPATAPAAASAPPAAAPAPPAAPTQEPVPAGPEVVTPERRLKDMEAAWTAVDSEMERLLLRLETTHRTVAQVRSPRPHPQRVLPVLKRCTLDAPLSSGPLACPANGGAAASGHGSGASLRVCTVRRSCHPLTLPALSVLPSASRPAGGLRARRAAQRADCASPPQH